MRGQWLLPLGIALVIVIIFGAIMLTIQGCSDANWCRLPEMITSAAITVIIGGLLAGGVHVFYRVPKYSKQERILLELAKVRLAGVKLRNNGNKKSFDDKEFDEWNNKIEKWKRDLYEVAKKFSPVEGERLRTLDDMPAQVFNVTNPDQVRVLRYVSETLRRLDKLLEQRFRPKMAP